MYSTLSVLQSDLREVLEHPISLEPRDVLVQEKVALSFLPFFMSRGLGTRTPYTSKNHSSATL
jgi:hypothetical protein